MLWKENTKQSTSEHCKNIFFVLNARERFEIIHRYGIRVIEFLILFQFHLDHLL